MTHVLNPARLLAAVPPLLGFRPEKSLIVINIGVLHEESDTPAILRFDDACFDGSASDLARLICAHGGQSGPVALIVVGDGNYVSPPPHSETVKALRDDLKRRGSDVRELVYAASITAGALWCSYDDPDTTGELPDPRSTPVAAEAVRQGRVIYDSRAEIAARFAPALAEDLRRMRPLVEQRHSEMVGEVARDKHDLARSCLATVDKAVASALEGNMPDDGESAAVIAALSIPVVRVAHLVPREFGEAAKIEDLWIYLYRVAPRDWAEALTTLIACSAYCRGETIVAAVALEVVDQRSEFESTLAAVIRAGIPPQVLTRELVSRVVSQLSLVSGAQPAPRSVVVGAHSGAMRPSSASRCIHLDHRIQTTDLRHGTLGTLARSTRSSIAIRTGA